MPKQIILIMTDTQRQDMVGAYGIKEVKTPCLDQLAQEGVLFTNAYTTNPVCGPARSTIFSGLYSHSNGVVANGYSLRNKSYTMGERLQELNMNPTYIGKWHLDGGDYFGDGVCPNGWNEDYWYDMRCYLEELDEKDRIRSRKPRTVLEGVNEEFTFAHRCSNRAIDFIEKNKDNDFLLVVSYDEPHHPYIAPKEYYDMFKDYQHPFYKNLDDTLDSKPEHQKLWSKKMFKEKWYKNRTDAFWFGCNSFVDFEIGRVLDTAKDLTGDAMIMYTSDHGGAFNSHRIIDKGPAMYEEITKIPFIVKAPGVTKTPFTNTNTVSHVDILPTILEYIEADNIPSLEGQSIINEIEELQEKDDYRFIEFNRYEVDHDGFGGFQPIRCIVNNKYKLVINLLTSDEFYDLEKDPYEMVNEINNDFYDKVKKDMHKKLLDWQNETRDPYRGYYWAKRSWNSFDDLVSWDYTGYTRQYKESKGESKQLDYANGLEIDEYTRKK